MVKLSLLALLAACAHVPVDYPCRPPGVESRHGTCYWGLGEDWTLEALEAREAWWLALMSAHPKAREVLSRMNVRVLDDYTACGGGRMERGCLTGPTEMLAVGLPLCRAPIAHELAHALFAAEGNADYEHERAEWGAILTTERDCPPLTGDWLKKTSKALESWGVRQDGGVE